IYIRNNPPNEAARRLLQQISELKTQIANNEAERRQLDTDVQSVTKDEERNRQNIASLSTVSGQQQIVQDYARKLTDQETQIAGLHDRGTRLDNERAQLRTQLNSLIDKLEF
ncbi:MAG: hypothetical protein ABUS49_07635, partial [Acidobacteriota bacterium]